MSRYRPLWLAALGLATACAAPARAQESHRYLPDDTEQVATLNFRQILESELLKSHKEQLAQMKGLVELAVQNNEIAKKYLEALGFDFFRDFKSATVAAPATVDPEDFNGLIILEGNFNPEKFQKTAEEAAKEYGHILKAIRIGEHRVWAVTPPGQDKTAYVALVNRSTLLAGGRKRIMEQVLERSPGTAPDLKKEVKELLKTTSPTQSFSYVTTGPALSNLVQKAVDQNPDPKGKIIVQMAAPVLQAIAALGIGVTVRKDIDFQIGIGTKDKKAADDLSKQLSGFILLGRGMVAKKAKEDPKVETALEVMKTLRTTVEGTTVLVRGQLSAAVLEKALKNAGP
jgi:hypothetical protein